MARGGGNWGAKQKETREENKTDSHPLRLKGKHPRGETEMGDGIVER